MLDESLLGQFLGHFVDLLGEGGRSVSIIEPTDLEQPCSIGDLARREARFSYDCLVGSTSHQQ
jgi:hypothetical protein